MKRDCDFLESSYVMDYSLLLGIHYRNRTELNGVSETVTPHPSMRLFVSLRMSNHPSRNFHTRLRLHVPPGR